VSIIIPAYKAAKFIVAALESVFAQKFKNFEVVVINDGSPDTQELEAVLRPYRDSMTYILQPNRGPAAARNAGIRSSSSEYVALLDSDDRWDPEYLEAQLALLDSPQEPDLVYSDLRMVGEGPRAGKTYMEDCPSIGLANFESILREVCHIPNSAVVARRKTLIEAGLFDESQELRGLEDWNMWLRIAFQGGRIQYQRKVLGTYLLRSDSLSADAAARITAAVRMLTKLGTELDLSRSQRATLHSKKSALEARYNVILGKSLLLRGDYMNAKNHFESAGVHQAGFKVSATTHGLRVAPGWTRTLVAHWKWMLQFRSKLRRMLNALEWWRS
jgi:GT2 family glycosyltransferase